MCTAPGWLVAKSPNGSLFPDIFLFRKKGDRLWDVPFLFPGHLEVESNHGQEGVWPEKVDFRS